MPPEPSFILVTGGTGFLGSHIVQQLLEGGYRVRCTARPLKSRFLEAAHLELVRSGQLEVVEIRDLAVESLERVLEGITGVIHTAFPAPGSMESIELLLNATSSTTSLLRQAYEHGVRKFVLTSSYLAMVGAGAGGSAGDGTSARGEEEEEGKGVWSEYVFSDQDWTHATYDSMFTGTHDPAWAYAAAKTLAEAAAWDFASARPDFDLATVLPTLLLGPFSPGHAVLSTSDLSTNVLLHSLLTSGAPPHPVWPHFVDVRDAARAHVTALQAPSFPVTSTDPSDELDLGTRQASEPPRSGPACLTVPSIPSNPSLVDLESTLQDLHMKYQTTPGSPTSAFVTTPQSPTMQSVSPILELHSHVPLPRKRFIATGTSFTWPDAITYLRATRPDLSSSLPDERACLAMPEKVAGVDSGWSGAEWANTVGLHLEGTMDSHEERDSNLGRGDVPVWNGLGIQWRDWRETVEDAVKDLERVAGGLERSGWEDLFGDDEGEDDNDSVLVRVDNPGNDRDKGGE